MSVSWTFGLVNLQSRGLKSVLQCLIIVAMYGGWGRGCLFSTHLTVLAQLVIGKRLIYLFLQKKRHVRCAQISNAITFYTGCSVSLHEVRSVVVHHHCRLFFAIRGVVFG